MNTVVIRTLSPAAYASIAKLGNADAQRLDVDASVPVQNPVVILALFAMIASVLLRRV